MRINNKIMKFPVGIVTFLYALVAVLPSLQAAKRPACMDFQVFCSYDDVQDYLAYLKQNYPGNLQLEDIAETYHGHKLTLVKIIAGRSKHRRRLHLIIEKDPNEYDEDDSDESEEYDDDDEYEARDENNKHKKDKNADIKNNVTNPEERQEARDTVGIWIDSMIHAREWLALPVTLYLLEQLVENGEQNQDMLKHFDWYILPLVNPSGYEFSRKHDRMWRKNLAPKGTTCGCSACGVDLNRNFDIDFESGSRDKCEEVYIGPSAASEPETKAISTQLNRLKEDLLVYIAIHTAGFKFYVPWAYKPEKCHDYEELSAMAQSMCDAIESVYGRKFSVETFAADVFGPSGGGADDYAKNLGIKYSYTIELPLPSNPNAESVFHAEASKDSEMAAKEQFAGFRAMCERLTGIYIDKTISPVEPKTRAAKRTQKKPKQTRVYSGSPRLQNMQIVLVATIYMCVVRHLVIQF